MVVLKVSEQRNLLGASEGCLNICVGALGGEMELEQVRVEIVLKPAIADGETHPR